MRAWGSPVRAGLLRLTGLRVALGLLGAGLLVWLGGRTLWSAVRVRAGMETDPEVASVGRRCRRR
jgi:putative LysE/RhtB family amino acid efflux pump